MVEWPCTEENGKVGEMCALTHGLCGAGKVAIFHTTFSVPSSMSQRIATVCVCVCACACGVQVTGVQLRKIAI